MLNITDGQFAKGPSTLGRRDFLRIGSLCGLSLPTLLSSLSQASSGRDLYKKKSVVFLFHLNDL